MGGGGCSCKGTCVWEDVNWRFSGLLDDNFGLYDTSWIIHHVWAYYSARLSFC